VVGVSPQDDEERNRIRGEHVMLFKYLPHNDREAPQASGHTAADLSTQPVPLERRR
jgi:hypothetical protein